MVFPTITIDGKAHEIECIDYMNGKPTLITVTLDGKKVYFWDKYSSYNPEALDLVEVIEWQGRYEPVVEAFENLTTIYEQELIHLSKKIAKLFVENVEVHPSISERYKELKQLIKHTYEVKNSINRILQK